MTIGLGVLIGVIAGFTLGFGLCSMLTVSREAEERAAEIERKQWSEYYGDER